MVKKSGISIEQCIQGFRLIQLLKNLGIGKKVNLMVEIIMMPRKFPHFSKSYIEIVNLGIPPEILDAMTFGLKELKQLWLTISEIAKANNILAKQAVSKILKDVDKKYSDKLWFEDKVNEKRNKIAILNNQVNYDLLILQATHFIGSALLNLFRNGVSEQEIVGTIN